jgi:hypothetical protein
MPHPVTAVAATDCRISHVPPGQIAAFLRTRPTIAMKLAESLAIRCRQMMELDAATATTATGATNAATSAVNESAAEPAGNSQEQAKALPKASSPVLLDLAGAARLSLDSSGQLLLCDVADPTATFINGFPADEAAALNDQDLVQVGRHVFQVHLDHPHRIKLADELSAAADAAESAAAADAPPPPAPEEPLPPPPEAPPAPRELDEGQSIESAIAAEVDALVALPLPGEVLAAIDVRLAPCIALVHLEAQRDELARSPEGRQEAVEQELARQLREVQRIPAAETLEKALAKVRQQLTAQPAAAPPAAATLAAEDEFDTPDSEAIIDGPDSAEPAASPALDESAPPAPSPALVQALEFSCAQKEHLLGRARLTRSTLRACAGLCIDEPLYRILVRYELPAEELFGWAAYAAALQELRHRKDERLSDLRLQRQSAQDEARSIMSGVARTLQAQAAITELTAEEHDLQSLLTAIGREERAIQRDMVDEFWKVYQLAAVRLVEGVDPAHAPYLRAFLRWGLLACSARFVDPALAKRQLVECTAPPVEPVYRNDAVHILYADEIIELAARGLIPPSPNEDLELNAANTPPWKADRAWRRIIAHRIQKSIHQDMLAALGQGLAAERRAGDEAAKRLAMVNARDPKAAEKRASLKDQIQQHKVEATRKERLSDIMTSQLLPRLDEKLELARKGLTDSGVSITPATLAQHEAVCMRQYARLANKLAEPFWPLGLTEQFARGPEAVNDRPSIAAALAELEKLDPLVFCEPMVQGTKKAYRVLLRQAPIVAIAPGMGIMAISICPRTDTDNGLFVLPAAFSRPGLRAEALRDVVADYRFDTSKASAGVDIMMSDTLVAAYAEYRWNMRKRDRDIRQKAGIYTEENDRANWRRHYEYYIKSATDSAKQLFFRSPELYERIVGKFLDLPEGQEVLKRS